MKKLFIISLLVFSLVLAGCKEDVVTGKAVVDFEIGTCEDSDGGIDKSNKGTVSVEGESFTDQCIAGLIIEYYCDNGKALNQNMRCSNGCRDGRCT